MDKDNNCFFCGSKCEVYTIPLYHRLKKYECEYCGTYLLSDFPSIIDIKNILIKFKIACVLNERRLKGLGGVVLVSKADTNTKVNEFTVISIDDLLNEFPKKAIEFLNRALLNLSRLPTQPFEIIRLDMSRDYLRLFTSSKDAGYTFLRELAKQEFIRFNEVAGGPQWDVFSLTTKFWETIENLQKTEVGNKRAFVAMWFDGSMDDYYKDGIKKAIEDAGYVPIRIDMKDFNDKICDEIIAEIKRTKFLIADFSRLRSGVFFEAGFAKGLGKEVIFTVRKEDVDQLKEHFDTRQYNHIVYDSPEDLHKKLYNRICATIV